VGVLHEHLRRHADRAVLIEDYRQRPDLRALLLDDVAQDRRGLVQCVRVRPIPVHKVTRAVDDAHGRPQELRRAAVRAPHQSLHEEAGYAAALRVGGRGGRRLLLEEVEVGEEVDEGGDAEVDERLAEGETLLQGGGEGGLQDLLCRLAQLPGGRQGEKARERGAQAKAVHTPHAPRRVLLPQRPEGGDRSVRSAGGADPPGETLQERRVQHKTASAHGAQGSGAGALRERLARPAEDLLEAGGVPGCREEVDGRAARRRVLELVRLQEA